jgi:hypothetical protein
VRKKKEKLRKGKYQMENERSFAPRDGEQNQVEVPGA